jgi:hypothetical protein
MTSPLPEPVTQGWSPKAVVAAVVAFAVSVLVPAAAAVIEHLTANPQLFESLPGWAQAGVHAALVALSALVAARLARPGVVVTPDLSRGSGDL